MHVCASFRCICIGPWELQFEYVLFCLFKFQDTRNERKKKQRKHDITDQHSSSQRANNIIDDPNQLFTIVNRFKSIHHCFAEAFQSHRSRSNHHRAESMGVVFFLLCLSLARSLLLKLCFPLSLRMCVCVVRMSMICRYFRKLWKF